MDLVGIIWRVLIGDCFSQCTKVIARMQGVIYIYFLQGVVCNCNSDSWNELVIPDSFSGKGFAQNPAVVLKGCPYWTAGARIWK